MITGFLWKGVVRDRGRSIMPFIVVTIGVFVVVFMDGFMGGMLSNMIDMTARFDAGHLKVVTKAYEENDMEKNNDLAILEAETLFDQLRTHYPQVSWSPRIFFGGLLDIPDAQGETLAQGPVAGTAYDLLTNQLESERLHLEQSLVAGRLISSGKEALVSVDFAERFEVSPGDTLTFFGSTMYGSMSFTNLTVAGIVRFGNAALDRGAIIVDISYARQFLDMENATTEIFGFLPDDIYKQEEAEAIKRDFNTRFPAWEEDEYAPYMLQLADQSGMGDMLAYMKSITFIMVVMLVFALSIVLWNTGVLGGIRRYNEFGIRLAMGEPQGHIYRTMLLESLMIGAAGSVMGTILGVLLALYMRTYGLDYGSMMDNISMLIDPVIRAEITPRMFWVGFIPGVISILIGTALAGMAVYRRKTAELFRELS